MHVIKADSDLSINLSSGVVLNNTPGMRDSLLLVLYTQRKAFPHRERSSFRSEELGQFFKRTL